MAIFLYRELAAHSLLTVGAAFAGRDATTVMHSERKIRNLEVQREDHRGRIDRLTATLRE